MSARKRVFESNSFSAKVKYDKSLVDPNNIFEGEPFHLKKCTYQGYATTIYSVDQAIAILDYIGKQTQSEDCLPFAMSLVENGELISIAEDNGEFGCGDLLAHCLNELHGYNVLVVVSRKIRDFFVLDMLQQQKHRHVKLAADSALGSLLIHLLGKEKYDNLRKHISVPNVQDIADLGTKLDSTPGQALPSINRLPNRESTDSFSIHPVNLSKKQQSYNLRR